MKHGLIILFAALLVFFKPGWSQDLDETLQKLSQDAAAAYLNPISSAFSTDLNGAWFHKAPVAKVKSFNLEIGFVGMGAQFPTDAKTFSTNGFFRFNETQARNMVSGQGYSEDVENALVDQLTQEAFEVSISGPTIIGSPDEHIMLTFPAKTFTVNGESYTVPEQNVDLDIGGFRELANAEWLPLIAPQISIGTLFGTQATVRYLPEREIQPGMGNFKYFGYGIQHNPAVWLPFGLPFDVGLNYFTQTMDVGSTLNVKASGYGINVSKQLGWRALNITPYAGFLLEDATMRVTYDYTVQTPGGTVTDKIDFDLPAENKSRVNIGINVRFVLLNVNVDYNIGKYNSITAGIFLAI
jgi:hypothetical protein